MFFYYVWVCGILLIFIVIYVLIYEIIIMKGYILDGIIIIEYFDWDMRIDVVGYVCLLVLGR